jgi:hypothetical protein
MKNEIKKVSHQIIYVFRKVQRKKKLLSKISKTDLSQMQNLTNFFLLFPEHVYHSGPDERPPGGARTREVGRSVIKLPQFWLVPDANALALT